MVASYEFGPFRLDAEAGILFRGAEPVALGSRGVALLRALVGCPGALISKDVLIEAAWPGLTVEESNLTVQIGALRRAIEEAADEHRIDTLPRRGYRFVGPVRCVERLDAVVSPVEAAPVLALPDKPSIAVLPFANMSSDPEQDYFAEGMAEEIITALSHCSSLFVIARNSSFTYKGKSVDIRQVGRDLGVRYVLEGSVRRGGDRLRFTGQLIDATSGLHIWADRFEGNMGDVFGLQDQLTESIVAAIEPKLQLAEIGRLKNKPAKNLDSYDLLLRAHQLEYEFTEESLTAALRHLDQALALDPSYAPAMALAARCHTARILENWTKHPEADTKEGLRLARRAVELGNDDAGVLWMAAYVVLRLQADPLRAKELAYRSLHLNPNSPIALAETGRIEVASGNGGRALQLLVRAERLSPCDPRGWFIASWLASAYFLEGRYSEAAIAARKAMNQNPRSTIPLRMLAANLVKLGCQDEAAKMIRQVLAIEPELTLRKLRARMMFIQQEAWQEHSAALRLAGLPE
jgi:TolB-like protein